MAERMKFKAYKLFAEDSCDKDDSSMDEAVRAQGAQQQQAL